MVRSKWIVWTLCAGVVAPALAARCGGGELKEAFGKVQGSIVLATFYAERENGAKDKRQVVGVLVDSAGTVAVHGGHFPAQVPLSKFSDIKVRLRMGSEKESAAEFVNRDEDLQVAILRVTEKIEDALTPIETGDPKSLALGDAIFSLHLLPEAYGYSPAFSLASFVKLIEKPQQLLVITPLYGAQLGCPVYDMSGKFMGMVCRDPLGARFSNVPVVMPADRLKPFFEHPAEKKKQAWIGVSDLQPLTADMAQVMGLPEKAEGVIVGRVLPGGPAEAVGLKAKDIVTRMGDSAVSGKNDTDVRAFIERVKALKVGDDVALSFLRDKKEEKASLKVGEKPKAEGEAARHEDKTLGMVVRELVYWDKIDRQLPQDAKGLMVQYVKSGSWPQLGGLMAGDILQKIDDVELSGSGPETLEQFKKIAGDLKQQKRKKFVFFVSRGPRGENATYINVEADWDKAAQ